MKNSLYVLLIITLKLQLSAQIVDIPFRQATSIKYSLTEELAETKLLKVCIDYNDIVYVLTDKGLYRGFGNTLSKEKLYRPLTERIPVDIAIQENTGYLYYLYEDQFLTNAYAGKIYANLPKGVYHKIVLADDGRVLLIGHEKGAIFSNGNLTDTKLPKNGFTNIYSHQNQFYSRTKTALYHLVKGKWESIHTSTNINAVTFRDDEAIIGTDQGYYGINLKNGAENFPLQSAVPVPQINHLLTVNRQIWAGTDQGAFERREDGSYRYYASKRWLDDDQIIDLAADSKGNVYLLTPSGLNKIDFISQTLVDKTTFLQEQIRQYHIRYGFISNLRLQKAGDITSAEMIDTDNDGLWTSFYLGSQALRYAVTNEPNAKRYVWEAFEAYERILSINQLEGFPSRTFERKGFKVSDPIRWRDSDDPEWEWKGHTSSDEFVGYIFITAMMDQLIAQTESEKKRVADFMDAILMHIIRNAWTLVDIDKKPTLWAKWHPDFVNNYAPTVFDRRLNSATIIAGLQLGYALTGKELYKSEAFKLMNEHGYRQNMKNSVYNIKYTEHYYGKILMGTDWNHSDDEMAFLMYWVLYHYAFNEELKAEYAEAIREHWEIERPEKNALWNLLAYGTSGDIDLEGTQWHLREFPMDLIRYNVKNSHRKDIKLLPENFRRQYTEKLLPPSERPMHRHNANPFQLDGGQGGKTKLAGDEYLLPYWLGRYLGVIEKP